MLVELKNGETYNGHLVSCDNWMNINLREVICTSRVCLAAGAEAGSQAQEEVSQKRSQVGRQANSEPALHPPETELPEAAFLLQSMSLFRMERGRRWGNPPCRTFCDPPLYVKSCLFFWPALLQLEILLSVFGFVKTQPT
nr:LSM4-like protein, U6 small nuclear RNA and mRNA degradation associated [Rousettus aegyptiacus]